MNIGRRRLRRDPRIIARVSGPDRSACSSLDIELVVDVLVGKPAQTVRNGALTPVAVFERGAVVELLLKCTNLAVA